jgi:hypothetical protein
MIFFILFYFLIIDWLEKKGLGVWLKVVEHLPGKLKLANKQS